MKTIDSTEDSALKPLLESTNPDELTDTSLLRFLKRDILRVVPDAKIDFVGIRLSFPTNLFLDKLEQYVGDEIEEEMDAADSLG